MKNWVADEVIGRPRARAVVLTVLAVFFASTAVWAVALLPGAVAEGDRYRQAQACAVGALRWDCLAGVQEKVLEVKPRRGKIQGWVLVDSVDFYPGPGMAGRTQIATDDDQLFHVGDLVRVTWWQGGPVGITTGDRQVAVGVRPEGEAPFELGWAVTALTGAVVTGWGAVRGYRRRPLRSPKGAPLWTALLIALAFAWMYGASALSIPLTVTLQALVLLIPATVLTLRWRRRS